MVCIIRQSHSMHPWMQIRGPCAAYVEGSSAAVEFLGPKLCASQVLIAVPLSSKMVTSAYTLTINGASQGGLLVKNPAANAGDIRDLGSIPESGEAPGGGLGNPLQDSCLDRGAWQARVHSVAKNPKRPK